MYKVVIGLEVHCELETKTKNFSFAPNSFSDISNDQVSAVDLGLPGILPLANKQAVYDSILTSLALNCKIPDEVIFDRKNYFYPDLPKGYQITQNTKPMGVDGYLDILVNDKIKRIYIHDLHLEEDTASLEHYPKYSLIDYNRSGVPLMEIVTTPCISSADEAVAFLEELKDIFLYLGVSRARSDLGQMRCDVNISLMDEDAKELGTKVEMKNINAFNNVRLAIEYEIKRQSKLLDEGKKVVQETRRIAEDGKTYSMREKVDALDYKYFIEPNIPSTPITDELLNEIKAKLPELKMERYNKYINEYKIDKESTLTIIKNKDIADYFEKVISNGADIDIAVNLMTTSILSTLNKTETTIDELFIRENMLSDLVKLVSQNKLSLDASKKLLYEAIKEKISPIEIFNKNNLDQISDKDELLNIIRDLMKDDKMVLEYINNDNKGAINYFIGKVMKSTNRRANPNMSKDIIISELERMKNNG